MGHSGRTLQVVAVGDQPHDLEVGHLLARSLAPEGVAPFVKTVQMASKPTARVLASQLRQLLDVMPELCTVHGDVALSLGGEVSLIDDQGEIPSRRGSKGWSKRLLDVETSPFESVAFAIV